MSWLVAGLLWALTIVKAVTRRKGQSSVMLWCALVFALSFSTDINEVFQPFDAMLGGWNSTNIAGHLLFSAGVYLLSRSVVLAAVPGLAARIDRWNRVLLAAVLESQATSFAFVRTTGPSGHFSVSYGTQDAALWYAVVEILYTMLVLGATGAISAMHSGRMRSPQYRWGMRLIASGCALALATEATGMETVIRIHDGTLSGMSVLSRQHDVLFGSAASVLVIGFAVPSIAGWASRTARRRGAARMIESLLPVWEVATEGRAKVGLDDRSSASRRLHRMAVEIRDASAADPGVAEQLTVRFGADAESVLATAERFLSGDTA